MSPPSCQAVCPPSWWMKVIAIAAGQEIAHLVPRRSPGPPGRRPRPACGLPEAEHDRLINGARPEERREARRGTGDQADATPSHALTEVERSRRLFSEGVIARDSLIVPNATGAWPPPVMRKRGSARSWSTPTREPTSAAGPPRPRDARRAHRLPRPQRCWPRRSSGRRSPESCSGDTRRAVRTCRSEGAVAGDRHDRRHQRPSRAHGSRRAATSPRVRVGDAAWVTADAYGDRPASRVASCELVRSSAARRFTPMNRPSASTTKVLETLIELEAPAPRCPSASGSTPSSPA